MLFTSPHTVLCARWQPIYGYCTKWEREDNNTTAWENFILAVEKGPYMEASLRSPCELEVYVEALPPPHVHCCNRAAIYFYSETYHHMTSGTNLAKFAIPDNISLKVHYYTSNLIKKRKKIKIDCRTWNRLSLQMSDAIINLWGHISYYQSVTYHCVKIKLDKLLPHYYANKSQAYLN